MGFKYRADQISITWPVIHHSSKFEMDLSTSRVDGHRSLAILEQVLSNYKEDLIFFILPFYAFTGPLKNMDVASRITQSK